MCARPLCGSRETGNHPPPPATRRGPRGVPPRQLDSVTAVIARGERPVPFRTRKLSPSAPMVLHGRPCGRVGRRRTPIHRKGHPTRGGLFCVSRPWFSPPPAGGNATFCTSWTPNRGHNVYFSRRVAVDVCEPPLWRTTEQGADDGALAPGAACSVTVLASGVHDVASRRMSPDRRAA